VHAALTARRLGYEAVMVNCNPETVSTDYDVSDRLYFEPLTFEDVANVCATSGPRASSCSSAGRRRSRSPRRSPEAGIPILGTPQASIDLAEDRGRFGELLRELGIECPPYGLARTADEAGGRRRDRLPAARAALVRARRPRHGDRLQPRRARGVHGRRPPP
jgi:carbamoyl-phosphate synthase large subunit